MGTGYSREALERLALHSQNRIFEPSCLTEDYENGLRLHQLGARQCFLPAQRGDGSLLATREYFPRRPKPAIRQRARWLMGNVLQNWERHGWSGSLVQRYWLWRDRKPIAGSLLTAAVNLMSLYGLLRVLCGARARLEPVALRLAASRRPPPSCFGGSRSGCGVRARSTACASPSGRPCGSVRERHQRPCRGQRARDLHCAPSGVTTPLRWVKTEHEYPSRDALSEHKRTLVEVLLGAAYISAGATRSTRRGRNRDGLPLPTWLTQAGYLSEAQMAEAISLRESLPHRTPPSGDLEPASAVSCPQRVVRELRILPFRLEEGTLHVAASTDAPTATLHEDLRRFTALEIRFHVITPAEFAALADQVL